MDVDRIRNAIFRSIGLPVCEDEDRWSGATSRINLGSRSLREDVIHAFVDFRELPEFWFDALKFELRKLKSTEISLSGTAAETFDRDQYATDSRNLSDSIVRLDSEPPRCYCVTIEIGIKQVVRILLRHKAKDEG